MTSNHSQLLVFIPFAISSHFSVGLSDSIRKTRIRPKWWGVTSKIRSRKTATSVLLSLAPSDGSELPCCELPYSEANVTRNRRGSPDNTQWGTEALVPMTCKELNLTNNHMSDLGSSCSPNPALRWWQLQPIPWQPDFSLVRVQEPGHPAKLLLDSWPTKTDTINVVWNSYIWNYLFCSHDLPMHTLTMIKNHHQYGYSLDRPYLMSNSCSFIYSFNKQILCAGQCGHKS